MPEAVDWNTFGKNSKLPRKTTEGTSQTGDRKPLPKLEFMKINAGPEGEERVYRFRPLLGAVQFYKYNVKHNGKWRSAICEDPKTCPVYTKHQIVPSERYAINVIDRQDGKLKILEGPFSIFKALRSYYENTHRNPGKANGADFIVKVKGLGEKKRYDCSFAGDNTLTQEEAKLINAHGTFKLDKIFKVTPADKIEAKLFSDEEEKPKVAVIEKKSDVMSAFEDDPVTVGDTNLPAELDV